MRPHFFPRDEYFMRLALREAERSLEHDDVPIGAVVVHEGEVIGAGRNERELGQDPTAHAETIALREAARGLRSWRLTDAVVYVTLEPCAMCAGAIVLARVSRVVFGASDPRRAPPAACSTCSPSRASTIAPRWQEGCSPMSPRSCSRASSATGDRNGTHRRCSGTFARPRSADSARGRVRGRPLHLQKITRQGDQVAADVSRALAVRDV